MDLASPYGADDVVTAQLEYDLDAATAPRVAEMLRRVVQQGSRVILDMTAVTFMDCAGLSALMQAHRRAAEGGGWLRLASVQSGPMLVLELTHTAELLIAHSIPEQRRPQS